MAYCNTTYISYDLGRELLLMEENKQSLNRGLAEKSCRTQIIIHRTFGNEDLLDLYADYVAEKVMSQFKKPVVSTSGEEQYSTVE